MKKHLLKQSGSYYKTGMHLHTTVSDGKFSPEEVKAYYQSLGYSVLAFTDHEVFVPQNGLTDENFVALNAIEIDLNEDHNGLSSTCKCAHLNLYAKSPDTTLCPLFSSRYLWNDSMRAAVTEEHKQFDYVRHYSTGKMNELIRIANENGFFVCFNHPLWSQQNYPDYIGAEGLWGVEVYNHSCYVGGYHENPQAFLDLLREGKTVYPVCSDDSHSRIDCGGGYLWVNADSLTYENIVDSLLTGNFYASTGPEIREFSIDGSKIHVECSEAVSVSVLTERRSIRHKGGSADAPLTSVDLDLSKYLNDTKNAEYLPWKPFIRLEVTDAYGRTAYTRAYYLDEITEAAE